MKTLKDSTIIYDDECPMCALYTHAFIRMKFLEKNGRQSYGRIVCDGDPIIDTDRARNEIALINHREGTVTYGLDSLLKILSNRWPWLGKLYSWRPLYRCTDALYKFISYNRKVIAPSVMFEADNSCTPDFHRGWRWAYIAFAWILTSAILTAYSASLASFIGTSTAWREFIVCGMQIVWQGSIVFLVRRDRTLHYLGNMMTISLAGALALLPAAGLKLLDAAPLAYLVYFGCVVTLMFLEHIRRVRILGLPWHITLTWALYRIMALILILAL